MQPQMSFEPLTPTAFLRRSAAVFGDRVAVIDGERRYRYAEFLDRALKLAGALRALGVAPGARVAVLAPNTHVLLEAHYGVPFAGAVLVALNPRFSASDLAWIIRHSEAPVLIYDHEFEANAQDIAREAGGALKLVRAGGADEYEQLLAAATPHREPVADERGLLSINYTSGTTGRQKGVMYHHRGAYLQALAMAAHMRLDCDSVYLWTLPMFHCNGWCFTWGVTAAGATHLCLRKVDPALIWRHLRESNVTHLSAAPTVLIMLAWAQEAALGNRQGHIATGGAPPTPALLTHGRARHGRHPPYGLTETRSGGDLRMACRLEQAGGRAGADQGAPGCRQRDQRIAARGRCRRHDVPPMARRWAKPCAQQRDARLPRRRRDAARGSRRWFRTGDFRRDAPGPLYQGPRQDIIISAARTSHRSSGALSAHAAVLEAAVVAGPDPKAKCRSHS